MRTVFVLLLVIFLSADCIAQNNLFDQGIRDTLTLYPSTIESSQSETKLKIELWVLSDEPIIAFTGVFNWDNPKVRIDSVAISPLLRNSGFSIFLFHKDNIDSSNAYDLFQIGGVASTQNLEGFPSQRLWATYYFTLADWHAGDSVQFDTLSGIDSSLRFVTNGPFSPVAFKPEFNGPMKYSGIETGIKDPQLNLPSDFVLFQNFPNPFNPSTTIEFELKKASDIELTVYNITGQEVATIFRGHLSPGPYRYIWNGRSDTDLEMPSGIYLYKLIAGENSESRKMMLIR